MKKIQLCFIFFFLISQAFSQNPNWGWGPTINTSLNGTSLTCTTTDPTTGNTETTSIKGKLSAHQELTQWSNDFIVEALYKKDKINDVDQTTAQKYFLSEVDITKLISVPESLEKVLNIIIPISTGPESGPRTTKKNVALVIKRPFYTLETQKFSGTSATSPD